MQGRCQRSRPTTVEPSKPRLSELIIVKQPRPVRPSSSADRDDVGWDGMIQILQGAPRRGGEIAEGLRPRRWASKLLPASDPFWRLPLSVFIACLIDMDAAAVASQHSTKPLARWSSIRSLATASEAIVYANPLRHVALMFSLADRPRLKGRSGPTSHKPYRKSPFATDQDRRPTACLGQRRRWRGCLDRRHRCSATALRRDILARVRPAVRTDRRWLDGQRDTSMYG